MSREQNKIAIISGVRTPFFQSQNLPFFDSLDIGVSTFREVIYRSEILPENIDETILSQCGIWTKAPSCLRSIPTLAGILQTKPISILNNFANGGLLTLALASEKILSQKSRCILTGGTELSNLYPWVLPPSANYLLQFPEKSISFWKKFTQTLRFTFSCLKPYHLLKKYIDSIHSLGETLAKKFGISREEQDKFALKSHRLALQASEEGKFVEELLPLHLAPDFDICIEKDQGPKENLFMEQFSALPPSIDENGTITRGNSSFLCEGSASLLLSSRKFVKEQQIQPLGYIKTYHFNDCKTRGLASILSAELALKEARLSLQDMDLIEIHEDTASSAIAHYRTFESRELSSAYLDRPPLGAIDLNKINVNGGAIALGHPFGISGFRTVLTLLMELKRKNLNLGMVLISSGGGQGGAIILERES